MQRLDGFDKSTAYRGGFVSIGNFDGLHRGHQKMIAALVEQARAAGVPAVVLTFQPHPIQILRPHQAPPNLSTLEWKAELLESHGVDCLIAYPTDWSLLKLTPEEFFEQIVREKLQARGLVEGPNFFFGRDRAGDINTLRSLCDRNEVSLTVVSPVKVDGDLVSSSAVRALIREGEIARAADLLGHPYQIRGKVVRGEDRGRRIGFPTANVAEIETLLPPEGVYAGVAHCRQGRYSAAINVGSNPTFGSSAKKFEVHLLDFDGDLYGQHLHVDLWQRIREVVTFPDVAALQAQLRQDVQQVRKVVNQLRPH